MERRIFYSDNGTLTDYSVNLQNFHSGTDAFTFVAAEDAFYIGARMPFNHLYFKMDGTNVNANASVMTVSYWDSGNWRDAVELIDETASSGKSLAQSGYITWTPDKSYGWCREDTNYSGNSITGLTSVEIYDLYWLKITFSADLTANTAFSWVGQKFSDDNDLGSEYSDLARSTMIAAFETGKTTWEEQHIRAAKIIATDLIANGIIMERDQILDRYDFQFVAVSKVAEIAYGGMGDDYKDDKLIARNEYERRLNAALPRIDKDSNGREDVGEKVTQGSLYR
jgi:hypothetical protein